MDNMYSKYHTVIGYRLCNRSFFPHHLRVSVSYSEAGMNVPPFSRFRILLRLRRPQEPSSRQTIGQALLGRGRGRWTRYIAEEANEKVRLASRSQTGLIHVTPTTVYEWELEINNF